ncbi:hypothetical protein [Bacillus sp. RS11]|uniref:hypothetical protein n=1 Tax=Lysinibacillus sp. RS11 TaxID=3242682 RepID=UPI0035C6EC11
MQVKFKYCNDTNREISIHPGTFIHGCIAEDKSPIKPQEVRLFILPQDTYPWLKMWDYGDKGLQILISPCTD